MGGCDRRICIIGAGPGGLSAAYFLKRRGYKNVTVLESTGRVGGKCLSLNYGGRSFDIGANYVTSDYTEVLRLAKEFGAALYTEAKMTVASFAPDGAVSFTAPLVLLTDQASFVSVVGAALRYVWMRFRIGKIIDKPGFAGVSRREELCRSFAAWLKDNNLAVLTPMFEIPITAMGYGALDEIPAPYALKYMSPKTFLNMIFFGLGPATKMAEALRGWLSALVGESGRTSGRSLERECPIDRAEFHHSRFDGKRRPLGGHGIRQCDCFFRPWFARADDVFETVAGRGPSVRQSRRQSLRGHDLRGQYYAGATSDHLRMPGAKIRLTLRDDATV